MPLLADADAKDASAHASADAYASAHANANVEASAHASVARCQCVPKVWMIVPM